MKKQIINVSVLQAAKVCAALYFVVSIVMMVLVGLLSALFGGPFRMPTVYFIVAPVIYLIFGFIFTAIGAAIYNMVASVLGGIEFTTKEVD